MFLPVVFKNLRGFSTKFAVKNNKGKEMLVFIPNIHNSQAKTLYIYRSANKLKGKWHFFFCAGVL